MARVTLLHGGLSEEFHTVFVGPVEDPTPVPVSRHIIGKVQEHLKGLGRRFQSQQELEDFVQRLRNPSAVSSTAA